MKVALLDPRTHPPQLDDMAHNFLTVAGKEQLLYKKVSELIQRGIHRLPNRQTFKGNIDLRKVASRIRTPALKLLFEDLDENLTKLGYQPTRLSAFEVTSIAVVLCAAEQIGIRKSTRCISYPINMGKNVDGKTMHFVRNAGVPVQIGDVTGSTSSIAVALIATLADAYTTEPLTMTVERFSTGKGEDLRSPHVFLGLVAEEYSEDFLGLVETVVDDITGENINHISNVLVDAGAKDINMIPSIGKGGRPQYIFRVACDPTRTQHIIDAVFEAGLTLGVRVGQVRRVKLNRETVKVEVTTPRGKRRVGVKIARTPSGKVVWNKPEFEDLVRISEETGWSMNETHSRVVKAVYEKLLS